MVPHEGVALDHSLLTKLRWDVTFATFFSTTSLTYPLLYELSYPLLYELSYPPLNEDPFSPVWVVNGPALAPRKRGYH